MTSTLYRGGHVRADRPATALLADGPTVAWVGLADAAPPATDRVVELGGALLLPGFVDAHVHSTATGLALGGLDLTDAPSLGAALDALAAHARRTGVGGVLLGTGWDETRWPERRAPTAAELDRAAGAGTAVYLARTDVHSAVVSSALLAAVRPEALPGYLGDGLCRVDAHHAVRGAAYGAVTAAQRDSAQRRALAEAARLGIAAVHEMAGPDISSAEDLAALRALAAAEPGPEVVPYWSGSPAEAAELGAAFGGDLFVDGTLGSRTAALGGPYEDAHDTCGDLRVDVETLAGHLVACADRGLRAGMHVIGDRAIAAALDAFDLAADRVGAERLAGHRFEHVEMAGIGAAAGAVGRMARYRVTASVQPAFDARWGGAGAMYATRLGAGRAVPMNDLAAFAAGGVPLALSSDAPVTPVDPWGTLRAAVRPTAAAHALPYAAAFEAATAGGWLAGGGRDGAGTLAPGLPATFAVWQAPAAGPDGLPDLDAPDPTCLRTVVRGRTVYDAGAL